MLDNHKCIPIHKYIPVQCIPVHDTVQHLVSLVQGLTL